MEDTMADPKPIYIFAETYSEPVIGSDSLHEYGIILRDEADPKNSAKVPYGRTSRMKALLWQISVNIKTHSHT